MNCRFTNNGTAHGYDGEENIAVGYGFGTIDAGTCISLIGCTFSSNGGAGLYREGIGGNVLVSGCYFEANSRGAMARDQQANGEDALANKERPPSGYWASIIENSSGYSVYDTAWLHGKNGIWLKGAGNRSIQFRNCRRGTVIWAEHGNWEWVNSDKGSAVSRLPGIVYSDGHYHWLPVEGVPSGHPGHRIEGGVRYVMPAPAEGLTLYVDTDNGDDGRDGRTPEQAWKGLQKAADLLRNCTIDTPITIQVNGTESVDADFANMAGTGIVTIAPTDSASLRVITAKNVACRLVFAAGGPMTAGELRTDNCDNVRLSGVAFTGASEASARLGVWGGSNLYVLQCHFAGGHNVGQAVAAHENSRVYLEDCTIEKMQPRLGLRATTGAVIAAEGRAISAVR
jgi:hypothetical protein